LRWRALLRFIAVLRSFGGTRVPPWSPCTSSRPSTVSTSDVHSRGVATARRERCRSHARSDLRVSHPLAGLLRRPTAGLLHPAPGPGVHRVARCPYPLSARAERPLSRRGLSLARPALVLGTPPRFPRCASLRRTPLDARRTASPRPVPSLPFPVPSKLSSRRCRRVDCSPAAPGRCVPRRRGPTLRDALARSRAFGPRPSRVALTLRRCLRSHFRLRIAPALPVPSTLRLRLAPIFRCFQVDFEVLLVHRVRCVRRRCQPPHTLSIPWDSPLPPRTPLLCAPAHALARAVGLSGCPVTRSVTLGSAPRTQKNASLGLARSFAGALVSFSPLRTASRPPSAT